MSARCRRSVLGVVLALLLTAPSAARRIVAVGDVHGADQAFRSILTRAGLIDEEGRWSGGNAVLVQTGDTLDRGAGSLRVIELLRALESEARLAGGEVIALAGNHEIMNLIGDLRDVTPEMVRPLVDESSESRLLEHCKTQSAIVRRRTRELGRQVPAAKELRQQCVAKRPLGWVEYATALAPGQPLGRWLRSRRVAVELDGVIFVHGGLSSWVIGRSLEELDEQLRRELARFDRYRAWLVEHGFLAPVAELGEMVAAMRHVVSVHSEKDENGDNVIPAGSKIPADLLDFFGINEWMLMNPDGPLWFRDYASWSEAEAAAELPRILAAFDAQHIVVGHTPRPTGEIESRFDGRVFLIDTGMLAEVYNGAASALIIEDGRFEALYLDSADVLVPRPSP